MAARQIQRWYRRCQSASRDDHDPSRRKRIDRWAQTLRAFFSRRKSNFRGSTDVSLSGSSEGLAQGSAEGGTPGPIQRLDRGSGGGLVAMSAGLFRPGHNERRKPVTSEQAGGQSRLPSPLQSSCRPRHVGAMGHWKEGGRGEEPDAASWLHALFPPPPHVHTRKQTYTHSGCPNRASFHG